MPRLILDNCCGCVGLKKGCTFIGYIQMAMEISLGMKLAKSLWHAGKTLATAERNSREWQESFSSLVVAAVWLVLLSMMLGFTMSMLYGLEKNYRGPVKAYLIYSIVFMVISEILFVFNLSRHIGRIGEIVPNIFLLCLLIYFLLVIRSYYYKMEESREEATDCTA